MIDSHILLMAKIDNKYSALDIVNSDKWTKATWLSFFQDRLGKMEGKRSPFETMWDDFDNQTNAVSFYDNMGVLQVNIPLEKVLKEIYMGRTAGKMQYDILPDGQTDIEQLQPAKYALQFFLDGNDKDNFWKENKRFRDLKANYGSGIYYTGIRKSISYTYETKEDAELEDNEDILSESNFDKVENIKWFLFPKNVHCRDFYIDDNAYGQPDIQQAEDCIMKERLTATELELRYGGSKAFDIKGVTYSTDPVPKNGNDKGGDSREIIIYHYFHRITRKWLIVSNRDHIIYDGIYLYNDDKLPFENVQHYTNENRFRGEGQPERIAYLKAYKSEIFQDILSGAQMSSSVNLLTGNDDQIGQDWEVGGRGINIWRNTAGAEGAKQINASPNLNYFVSVLKILDEQIVVDSGINPSEQFEASSDKVGIVEIMEANKAIRNKSVDENYNIGLDSVLTMTLSRIKQFAPALLSTKVMNEAKTKVLKRIFPSIKISGHTIKHKKGRMILTEDLGKFGYFELKPGVVEGLGVKVVTPSTNSMLPILERQKVNEYIDNYVKFANMAAADQTGEMMKKLTKSVDFDDLIKWNDDAYQIDINGLKANTKKDDIAEENIKKMKQINEMLTINPTENVGQDIQLPTPGQAPTSPGGEQKAPVPSESLGAEL